MYVIQKVINQRRMLKAIAREEEQQQSARSSPKSGSSKRSPPTIQTDGPEYNGEARLNELEKLRGRLSTAEKRALRVTWNRLKGGKSSRPASKRNVIALVRHILEKSIEEKNGGNHIFTRYAFVKAMQNRKSTITTIFDHANYMTDMIEEVVLLVNSEPYNEEITAQALRVGCCHTHLESYGFGPELWENLGELFAATLARQECVRIYPYAQRAWNMVAASITDMFRSGYEAKVKQLEAQCGGGAAKAESLKSGPRNQLLDAPMPNPHVLRHPSFQTPRRTRQSEEVSADTSRRRLLPQTPNSEPLKRCLLPRTPNSEPLKRRLSAQPIADRLDSLEF